MNARNIDWRRGALLGALLALSALCLRRGTQAQENWSKLPMGFNQGFPERVGPLGLLGALGGMRSVAADSAYVDALQYVGNSWNFSLDNNFQQTYSLYREVLWLDPYFHFAVLEGCANLTWGLHDLVHGRLLMEEAMRVDPKFDRYRYYYAAMNYSEKEADHESMLAVLKVEIIKPDTPEMLLRQVGNLITRYESRAQAIAYWHQLLGRASEQQTLQLARKQLAILQSAH
jgi:hypothetical protein